MRHVTLPPTGGLRCRPFVILSTIHRLVDGRSGMTFPGRSGLGPGRSALRGVPRLFVYSWAKP